MKQENLPITFDFTTFILANYNSQLKIFKEDKTEFVTVPVDRNNPGDAFKVDLSSEYGRAKFKYLMDFYIIPHFKSNFRSNGFLSEYKFKNDVGFNMRKFMKFYMNPANDEVLLDIETGIEQLVRDEKNVFSFNATQKSNSEVLSETALIDLLFVYDRMVNLKRFGGNRSTTFLDLVQKKGSLAMDFLKHQVDTEQNSEKFINGFLEKIGRNLTVDSTLKEKEAAKNYREALYLSLFGNSFYGKRSYIRKDPDRNEDSTKNDLEKGIYNPYFKLVESISTIELGSKAIITKNLKLKEFFKTLKNIKPMFIEDCT